MHKTTLSDQSKSQFVWADCKHGTHGLFYLQPDDSQDPAIALSDNIIEAQSQMMKAKSEGIYRRLEKRIEIEEIVF